MTVPEPDGGSSRIPPHTWMERALARIERTGNALPHPATLFAFMAALMIVVSAIAERLALEVIHPGTGQPVRAVSLASIAGLHRIVTEMVTNFTGFAPLGMVLVVMLGIGVAEASGLLAAALKVLVLSAPRRLLTFAVVFAGVMSNTAGDVGHVLLPPLAASAFLAVGRHPIAGVAAAYAGVAGGYSANMLLGTIDPVLAGISQEAARIIDPQYIVNPAANYYFMAVSAPLLAVTGTFVTERIVEPRLGAYGGTQQQGVVEHLTPEERRGLRAALVAAALIIGLLVMSAIPQPGFLRDAQTGGLLNSPFMSGIVALVFIMAVAVGLAFGVAAGRFKSDRDVVDGMGRAMATLSVYLVLVFFASQFLAYFRWSNLGVILAVKGAEILRAAGPGSVPVAVGLVLVTATMDFVMPSASAKWAVVAPVFVPMLMLLGYTPEYTQAAYRVGDSVTNIISPMTSYFAVIVAFMQRYERRAGIGTLAATMLPYSIAFLMVWLALLVGWTLLELPVGPGAGMRLSAG
ncbi:MAG TPA: AbgT family transporter [Vicinamibacterales bacterium]|nr:AbgT family transporter [Vicinamibacterales bacterium]